MATGSKAGAHRGFGLYIHWPFCLSKCPYCDFNSHVRHQAIDEARFLDAYGAELGHRAALTKDRTVASIFFGGGTPSLMEAQTVSAILDRIADLWPLASDVEITLEANPTSVEAARFKAFRAAGVNRVSLGVQALNDKDLETLGRRHSAAEALAALDVAAGLFDRYSFDLIYARPGQDLKSWSAELKAAIALSRDHLSLYQLTIEPGTMFERMRDLGRLALPDEQLARDLFDLTQDLTGAAGLPAYEVSNHARPGAESRHNLIYWRYGEYAGIGPGAHGRIKTQNGRVAQAAEPNPDLWLAQVLSRGHGLIEDVPLSMEEQGDEFLLMGLRLAEGIGLEDFQAMSGHGFDAGRLASLIGDGFVEYTQGGRIKVSAKGLPVLDCVVADLAA